MDQTEGKTAECSTTSWTIVVQAGQIQHKGSLGGERKLYDTRWGKGNELDLLQMPRGRLDSDLLIFFFPCTLSV